MKMSSHIDYVMRRFEEVDNEYAARFKSANYGIQEKLGLNRENGIFGGCIAGLTSIVSQVTKLSSGKNNALDKKAEKLTSCSINNKNTGKLLLVTDKGKITDQAGKMYKYESQKYLAQRTSNTKTITKKKKVTLYNINNGDKIEVDADNTATMNYLLEHGGYSYNHEGTGKTEATFKDKYGHEYPYSEKLNYYEWSETDVVDLGNGHKVSTCTIKVYVPIEQNPDGYGIIEVKKHYFGNTNMVVYESGNGCFSPNPVSSSIGEKMSFTEAGKKTEHKTIDDLQKLNYNHRFDKWYNYGKIALNVGSDIITVSTFGMSAAASTSAKGVAIAFVKAVVPTTTKDAVQFTLIQGPQMVGDYVMYNSKPQDDLYKTVTGLLPGVGTYYAVMDTGSNDPLKGFYKPIK